MDKNQVIGHRGACGSAPENTIASFERAKALGCQTIEFDVMLSADGEAFIFHDETLGRTTNGRGKFGKMPAEYIRSLDAGKWYSRRFTGEKIPTLRETLDWLAQSDMNANIEIKPNPGMVDETTTATLMHINKYWPPSKPLPLVSSFNFQALSLCRSLSPELPIGFLLDKWDKNWHKKANDIQCRSVHINHRIATEKRIKEIKSKGYLVYVYTVNRKRKACKLFKWGADAVFSDYPERVVNSSCQ